MFAGWPSSAAPRSSDRGEDVTSVGERAGESAETGTIRSGSRTERAGRLAGLDGIRGLAALYVVLHHSWLMSYPGFPRNIGPAWTGWLLYGHLAVVVFITLSGFSLAVSPARSGWQVGGKARFARRRAWRILPPYWAALAFSLLIVWTAAVDPGEGTPTARSVVVHGLLLQDIFGSRTPNGAFWSIAVEAQLYVVFPLLLLTLRRAGRWPMIAAVTAVVVAIGLLAPHMSLVGMLMRLTPQFAVLFALGIVGAGIAVADGSRRRSSWPWLAALAAAPVFAVIALLGSVWTVNHFYWVDIALGPAITLLLVAVANGRPVALVRLLNTRAGRSLGSFSYSLYLTHAPILLIIHNKLIAPYVRPGLPVFVAMLAISVPVAIVVARLFAAFFELPFQRYRSWAALRPAVRARVASRQELHTLLTRILPTTPGVDE
jgi:peptidoglycan/LPS O-acetylase OafA/YrhL